MANTKSISLVQASSQYLSITDANQTGLDITGDISIMGWIKATSFEENDTLVSKEIFGAGTYGYIFRILAGKLSFVYRNSAGSTVTRAATNALSTATWYHIAVTVDVSAQTINFYVNSSLVAMGAVAGSATSIGDNAVAFRIGNNEGGAYYNGLIDELGVYNAVLTSTEISNDYNSGDGTERSSSEDHIVAGWRFEDDLIDVTSNDNDLTNNNSAAYSTDVPFEGSSGTTFTPKIMMF